MIRRFLADIWGGILRLWRWFFGHKHRAASSRAIAVREQHQRLLESMARQQRTLTEDDLETLQAHTTLRVLTEAEARDARPAWLDMSKVVVLGLVVVTAVFLLAIWWEASSIPIELDTRVDRMTLEFRGDSSSRPVTLDFSGIPLQSFAASGMTTPAAAAEGVVRPDYFIAAKDEPIALEAIRIPRDRPVDLEMGRSGLTITIGPPPPDYGKPEPELVVAQLVLPRSSAVSVVAQEDARLTDSTRRPRRGPATWSLQELDGRAGAVTVTVDYAQTGLPSRFGLGVVGVDLSDIELAAKDRSTSFIDSYILDGSVSFSFHQINKVPLAFRDVVRVTREGQPMRGQLLQAALVLNPAVTSNGQPWYDLETTWAANVQRLEIGREARRRSWMPKKIIAWAAEHYVLYLTSFVVYAGIFCYAICTRSRPSAMDAAELPGTL